MIFLQTAQATGGGVSTILYFGTLGMIALAAGLVIFVMYHQKRISNYQLTLQKMEAEQQKRLLMASIQMQEEERNRLSADLHDDAGPLLATARLYLNENLVHQDMATQLSAITNAKQIIDETIQLIRNISHNLMPPTLRNFGLESAVNDIFQKIGGSGQLNASCKFHDYHERLKSEKELLIFRVVQELVTNILKHSNANFIHLTQNFSGNKMFIRIHHDGRGLTQKDFESHNSGNAGLGLKNIDSRIRILKGKIAFEKDSSQTYYKVTVEMPKE